MEEERSTHRPWPEAIRRLALRDRAFVLPRPVLVVELVLLFVGLPGLYAWLQPPLHVLVALGTVMAGCLVSLLFDPTFDRRRLWSWHCPGRELRAIVWRFLVVGAIGTALVAGLAPGLLFELPRRDPVQWVLVLVFFPLLFVVPQGVVYRAFFFHRYRDLFGDGRAMLLASGVAFCLGHAVCRNLPALILAGAGGVLFARTYRRTGSLPVSCLEHALYGGLIFTVGLGRCPGLGS